jgi:hypothetical protein
MCSGVGPCTLPGVYDMKSGMGSGFHQAYLGMHSVWDPGFA